ncbi:MAG: FtsX-like permease family protein [Nitrospinota bacterium]|nr:FtsX-like permease family protein [Nitrospinota bacterium]
MNILPLAYRNIWRRKLRAVTTIGAMAFAGAIMIFYSSLMLGMLEALERNLIIMNMGDAQIHKEGYRSDPDLYTRIDGYEKILQDLEALGFKASPRLFGFGLVAHEQNSAGVSIMGVDIEREKSVTQTYKHLSSGVWLDDSDPNGVVLGRKLAKILNVRQGDELVLVSQAADGSMANDLYQVRGVLKGVGDAVDRGSLFMTQQALRDFMYIPDGVHEIVVLRNDRNEPLDEAMEQIIQVAGGNEAKSWKQLQPLMASLMEVSDASLIVMVLIMYAAVGMVSLNAMLMSVFERIREFGIMKALGVSPLQVMAVVVLEAAIQVTIACALAMAAGIPLSMYFETHGINFSALGEGVSLGGVTWDPTIFCHLTTRAIVTPLVTLVVIVLLAVIYPGIKAAVIRPVEAIHHI